MKTLKKMKIFPKKKIIQKKVYSNKEKGLIHQKYLFRIIQLLKLKKKKILTQKIIIKVYSKVISKN